MLTMSRYSRLEYWAFTQHCLSKVTYLVNNKLLTFFVIASSAYSFEKDSLNLPTSSRTVLSLSSNFLYRDRTVLSLSSNLLCRDRVALSLSSNLLCGDRTIGMRSCLHNLSSELPVYVVIFQLLKLLR